MSAATEAIGLPGAVGLLCFAILFTSKYMIGLADAFEIVLFIIGEDIVLISVPQWMAPALRYLGLGQHFASITRGVIDSRDLVYYLSVIGFFLYLNVKSVESRRWR